MQNIDRNISNSIPISCKISTSYLNNNFPTMNKNNSLARYLKENTSTITYQRQINKDNIYKLDNIYFSDYLHRFNFKNKQ